MKYLLLCEGANERTLINLLLDANKLKLTRDDLIGRVAYNLRQLTNPIIKSELKIYGQEVIVYRIGDGQQETFEIPKELENIVSKERIYRYYTKPELEILLIINEGLYTKYKKQHGRAKTFAKTNIKYHKNRYTQTEEFLKDYYGNRVDVLVENIKEYKKLHKTHAKGELYLADLLK